MIHKKGDMNPAEIRAERRKEQKMIHKKGDMNPAEIRAELIRRGVTQATIAQELSVSRTMVWRVIMGEVVSDRIRRAIAEAIGKEVGLIWPSTYIYGGGPKGPGRPAAKTKIQNAA